MSGNPAPRTVAESGLELDDRPLDAIVIGSQLAYGSVGAGPVERVLTAAGYRVALVPTTLLGSLPHYDTVHGGPIPDAWLEGFLSDLCRREVVGRLRTVVVGYLSSPEQAAIIGRWIDRLRETLPALTLIVDPAMGDDDVGLYTDPAVAGAYQAELLPRATGITPNLYELELLTNARANSVEEARAIASGLLGGPLHWVIVTSVDRLDEDRVSTLVLDAQGAQVTTSPRVLSRAKGAGDLFVAILVRELLAHEGLAPAATHAAAAVGQALADSGRAGGAGGAQRR